MENIDTCINLCNPKGRKTRVSSVHKLGCEAVETSVLHIFDPLLYDALNNEWREFGAL
jgi:hypothetical protein